VGDQAIVRDDADREKRLDWFGMSIGNERLLELRDGKVQQKTCCFSPPATFSGPSAPVRMEAFSVLVRTFLLKLFVRGKEAEVAAAMVGRVERR
jgi:hypothetical protein